MSRNIPGQQLGRYRIRGKIGAGGMGEVYLAHDTNLHRDIALKVLPSGSIPDSNARNKLLAEARAASRLNHPNICIVHEAGEIDDEVFISMEYIEGRQLSNIISPSGLTQDKIISYGLQLANALAHAHQRGVIHGDLKPSNVIVTPEDRLKLLDFGLAKRAPVSDPTETTTTNTLQTSGQLGGVTLAYASPEGLRGSSGDARSDIWCLGIVLYEMVVGRRPFEGCTPFELTSAIIHQPLPALPLTTPSGLEVVVRRCLEKKPGQRYQRVAEVAAALEAISAVPAGADKGTVSHLRGKLPPRHFLAVLVMIALLAFWFITTRRQSEVVLSKSVAVLPFTNLSSNAEQEYFADGMTDELITELGSISALKVISRTSMMRYKGTRQPLPEIAQQLNAGSIIQGSVLRSGNHVRITVQLTDGRTDHNLWAQSYERDLEDIVTLQAEIASAIASQISAQLTPQEEAHLARNSRVDPEAYQLYLRGRFFWEQRTPQGFQKALDLFHDSITRDPTYAPAYCGIADTYILQQNYGFLSFEDAHSLARAAALRAVELDSTLAEAHTSLASVLEDYDWNWTASESEYKRAIELNPSYATAHEWYGNLLSVLGRHDEAIAQLQKARELAPLSARAAVDLGYAFFHARQYDYAVQEGHKALELEPNLAAAHELLGRAYLSKKFRAQAITEFQAAATLTQMSRTDRALLAYAYATAGRKDLALKMVRDLNSLPTSAVPFYHIAMIYLALDNKDGAMATLEHEFSSGHDKWLPLIGIEDAFDPLRSEPRFQAIVKQLQLMR